MNGSSLFHFFSPWDGSCLFHLFVSNPRNHDHVWDYLWFMYTRLSECLENEEEVFNSRWVNNLELDIRYSCCDYYWLLHRETSNIVWICHFPDIVLCSLFQPRSPLESKTRHRNLEFVYFHAPHTYYTFISIVFLCFFLLWKGLESVDRGNGAQKFCLLKTIDHQS